MTTYVGWFIVVAACIMSAVCVIALGVAGVQRRAMIRYWSGKT